MSKKKWILFILVVAFLGYLIVSKIYPGIGIGIDNAVGPAVSNFFSGIALAITTSPTWIAYDIYFAMAFGIIVTSLLWWQGHNAYNKVRGVAVQSAVKEAGWQTTPPISAPSPVSQKTEPAPVIPIVEKKETSA